MPEVCNPGAVTTDIRNRRTAGAGGFSETHAEHLWRALVVRSLVSTQQSRVQDSGRMQGQVEV